MLHPSIEKLPLPEELKLMIQKNVFLGYLEELEKKWKPIGGLGMKKWAMIMRSNELAYVNFSINVFRKKIDSKVLSEGVFRFTRKPAFDWFYVNHDGRIVSDPSVCEHDSVFRCRVDNELYIGFFIK